MSGPKKESLTKEQRLALANFVLWVADELDTPVLMFQNKGSNPPLTMKRRIGMAAAVRLFPFTQTAVGRAFFRDRTSCVKALRLLRKDPEAQARVNELVSKYSALRS